MRPYQVKRKVCVVIASRANYGRIKSAMKAIRDSDDLELQIVVGASALLSRFGKAVDVMKSDGFVPDATVYMVVEGENPVTMAKSTGLAIVELATIFSNITPDVVLTVADRYETLATAIAASYINIPVAHTQGGEVTGSIDESVRHAITKLSHIHFPATEQSRERLIKMGESPEYITNSGCPSIDAIKDIDLSSSAIENDYSGVGGVIDWSKPYLLVIQHPVTTEFGNGLSQINQTLKAVHAMNMQTVWLWPNVDAGSDDISKGLRMFREKHKNSKIHFYLNFSVEDYARILNNAACAIGNSSSFLREGAFLGVPAVNIGSRQDARERGVNVLDADYSSDDILMKIRAQLQVGRFPKDTTFGNGAAGAIIADKLSQKLPPIQKSICY